MKNLLIEPKQPFFVTASETYCKYVLNRYGIVHFYRCFTGEKSRFAVPDGCIDMVFCCDGIVPDAYICGTVMKPETVLIRPHSTYFGVRFRPGFNPVPESEGFMEQIIGREIPFEELIHDRKMLETIWTAPDFPSQIKAFMESYMKMYRKMYAGQNSNLLVAHSIDRMIESGGIVRLESLAEETGYSERYINKSFRHETGLSPKQFSKIIRFQKSVSALNSGSEHSLTDIAAELGYFDQPHFDHEFKAFTNLTPKHYLEQLRSSDFYEKLRIIKNI